MLNILISFLISSPLFAQTLPAKYPSDDPSHVTIDIPVVDQPFTFMHDQYNFPSMRQAVFISTGFYQSVHRWIVGPENRPRGFWPIAGLITFDVLSGWIPPGNGWMHEEGHRAVMTNRNIDSYNDMNNLPIGADTIAVSHVRDEDLVRLKRDHPADQIRMSSAGMEMQVVQNQYIERQHFFDYAHTPDGILLWMNAINVSGYIATCAGSAADTSTDEQNEADGTSILVRDFTGLDCTGWVYDLYRPNEPYTARGVHPSGRGIDRYIKHSDLTNEEADFLDRQVALSLFNFLDPFLFYKYGFNGHLFGEKIIWNANTTHYLTSFGYTVDAHLFLKSDQGKYIFTLHNGFNDQNYFPGISIEKIDQQILDSYYLTSGFTIWSQPENQYVKSAASEMLVDASFRILKPFTDTVAGYIAIEGKTDGWLPGNVFLEKNVSVWTGLTTRVF